MYRNFENIENLNLENNNLINIKNDINNKIHSKISHKSTIRSFNKYIDSLGNDIEKLNIFNKQLDNLSKSINTLPRLFKSFTSQKRTENIKKKTIVKNKAVERIKKAFLKA